MHHFCSRITFSIRKFQEVTQNEIWKIIIFSNNTNVYHNILQEKQEENELRALPLPSPAQVTALSSVLMEAAKEHGISDDDFKIRQEIVCGMEKIIQQHLPGNSAESSMFCKEIFHVLKFI